MNQTIISTPTAEAIERDLRAMGFTKGAPCHIPPHLVAGDVASYRRMRCAACGHGGHCVAPWHRGREYRLLATCRKCAAGIEC